MLPSIIKFDICGDILVSRIFKELWHFAARGKVDLWCKSYKICARVFLKGKPVIFAGGSQVF